MFYDEEYIDEAIDELKNIIENKSFKLDKCNNFISYSDLEDEYSHDDIDTAQSMFMEKVTEYLGKEYPGKYAMWHDWCVHITTVELYRDIMWKDTNYSEAYIELKENRDIIK